jgi:hypothetical protein
MLSDVSAVHLFKHRTRSFAFWRECPVRRYGRTERKEEQGWLPNELVWASMLDSRCVPIGTHWCGMAEIISCKIRNAILLAIVVAANDKAIF